MDKTNEFSLAAVSYIGFMVATFLINSSRVLKAIELLKECLILLNNGALTKENKLVGTICEGIYLQLCNGYVLIKDYTNAIECCRELLVLLRESGEKDKQGKVTYRLAELYTKQGKYHEAKKRYTEALGIMTDTGKRKKKIPCYGHLGNVFWSLGEYGKDKECQEKALAIAKEDGDRKNEASCYANLGTVFQSLGSYAKAEEYHEKALKIAREIDNRKLEAYCYSNLGTVFHSLAEYTKAKKYQENALRIIEGIDDKQGEAFCYIKLGNVYYSINEYAKAKECHKKALAIAKEIGDKEAEADCYAKLGHVHENCGEYGKAIEYQKKSLPITKEIGARQKEASCYEYLGQVFYSVGEYSKATEFLKKAISISKEIDDRQKEASCYVRLGAVFRVDGENAKAKEYVNKALTITKEIGEKEGEANCYGELGNVLTSFREYEIAKQYYDKALAIAKEIGDKVKEATCYGNLGVLFNYVGEYAKTKEYFKKAIVISKKTGYIKLEQATHANFAMTMLSEGNIHEAKSHLLVSIDKFENIRSWLTGFDQSQISLFDEHGFVVYQVLASLFCATGNPDRALYVVELGRARTLADLMSAQYSIRKEISVNPQTWVGIESIIEDESNSTCLYISYYATAIYLWIFKANKPTRFRKIDVSDCFVSKTSKRSVDEVLGSKTFRQLHIVAEGQCEDRSWIPSNVTYPTSRLVEEEEDEDQQPDPTLAECYKMMIAPVADLLDEAEIIVVPDRNFYKVPFAALQDECGKYLSEAFRIRIVPSLTTLKLIQDSPADYHSRTGALIVGDPDVDEVLYKGCPERLPPLPFAREEAEMIARLLRVQPLLGKQATKRAILESIGSVSLIHFAAHGDAERGEIVLAPPPLTNGTPQEDDYLLTMADISEVRLRAKLVVLSCCHSARGQIRAEGVVGIAHAFLGSGARSVLVALWAIEDRATKQFMSSFYKHLVRGESASESLHQAMKWMRANGFSKVGQWAPFMLIGDKVTLDFGNES